MREVTTYAGALAALRDPAYTVPPVPDATAGVAWLRANVARFSGGAAHERRRGYALEELARIDPARLRGEAFDRAGRALAGGVPLATVARAVPVELLAQALGAPADVVPAVLSVAKVYLPGSGDDPAALNWRARPPQTPLRPSPAADAAVERLAAVFGADERGAARIGLLCQANEATAGLIARAVPRGDGGTPVLDVLLDTLRMDPPVRGTRRLDARQMLVFVDFVRANREGTGAHLTFGAGAHRCPGHEHATALAAGVVEAAWQHR